MSGITVTLPNGTREHISHVGTITISDALVLRDVLYVPSFRFNLLSVSSLLKHDNFSGHFFPDACYIQDHTQDLMIGRASLQHNPYVLDNGVPTSLAFCGSVTVTEDIWHHRLGHPSRKTETENSIQFQYFQYDHQKL